MSDIPRTDAILRLQPNDGFGLEKKQCIAQWYDHSAKIESENAELRAALETLLSRATELPQYANHEGLMNAEAIAQARAILERTKK